MLGRKFFRRASLPAALLLGGASERNSVARCWIAEEGVLFVGHFQSPESFVARYELIGEKRGPSGSSLVRQGGQVVVEANKPARLSQVSFGTLGANDHFSVYLRLFDGEKLVCENPIQK